MSAHADFRTGPRRPASDGPHTILLSPITYLWNSVTDIRHLKNITIQLHYRHPSSRRNVNSTDEHNVVALNAIWPDAPLLAPDVFTLRV
jgi:hypothetical protein